MKRLIGFLLLSWLVQSIQANELPIELFAQDSQYKTVKISPDGKYLAVEVPRESQTQLAVIELQGMKPKALFKFGENEHVFYYDWVNNERLVYQTHTKKGSSDVPEFSGQVFSANYDASDSKIIFGMNAYEGNLSVRMRKKGEVQAWGEVVSLLPDEPDYIAVRATHYRSENEASDTIYKVNVKTAQRSLITRTPFYNSYVLLSRAGAPIFAYGINPKGEKKFYQHTGDAWKEVLQSSLGRQVSKMSTDATGAKLYYKNYSDARTVQFVSYDIKTGSRTVLLESDNHDFHRIVWHPKTHEPVTVSTMVDTIEYYHLKHSSGFATLVEALSGAFGKAQVEIESVTEALDKMVVSVKSDQNSGEFFLFDVNKKNLSLLLTEYEGIDPKQMVAKKAISFKARDGYELYGYLSLPNWATKKKPVPLLVFVHGGPFGERDTWLYDPEVQLLANRGFAVLQVNYRGSGGFGYDYQISAYRKQHTLIQQDIIDGTRWAQSQPQILADKACIMGFSFGGYAAVMAPTIEPKLFQCSIAAGGPYDSVYQAENADYAKLDSFSMLSQHMRGETEQELIERSPLTYIEKFKTPVLIVHGGRDKRVPAEHAFKLKEALDKLNREYEWLYFEGEGHGFYSSKNRAKYYQTVVDFLDEHLN